MLGTVETDTQYKDISIWRPKKGGVCRVQANLHLLEAELRIWISRITGGGRRFVFF